MRKDEEKTMIEKMGV